MSPVEITSTEQFTSLLKSSSIVIADFYADWCGPCNAIAKRYADLAETCSRPNVITFTKINIEHQQGLTEKYEVTTLPTFIRFEKESEKQRVRGADLRPLESAIQKLATEASQSDNAAGTGEGSSEGPWIGGTVAKGYSDITDQVDKKGLVMLNRDSHHGEPGTLFHTSEPSGLMTKGQDKAEGQKNWVESDTDEQLMLYIPFQSTSKVHSIQVTSLPPDAKDDETPMRPKTLKIWSNASNALEFDEANESEPTQQVQIQPEDWDAKTGTATVALRFVKFQNVSSLVVFFKDGDGDSEKLRVDRVRIIGEAGANRNMGKLEKIGDEPGE